MNAKIDEKAKGTAVQKPAGGAVALPDYGQYSDATENLNSSDLKVPFIQILQALSPQVEQNIPEGSKPGLLFNSVTHELIDGRKGIPFIPCLRQELYLEWTPRESGGGLVERHDPASKIVKDAIAASEKRFGKLRLANGNDLVQTKYIYGLTLDDTGEGTDGFAVVSCSGTKLGPCNGLLTAMAMVKEAKKLLFAHRIIIRTFDDQNKKGKFKNFEFVPLKGNYKESLVPTEALLKAGYDFREMVLSGAAKPDMETRDTTVEEADTSKDQEGDGKAPF